MYISDRQILHKYVESMSTRNNKYVELINKVSTNCYYTF